MNKIKLITVFSVVVLLLAGCPDPTVPNSEVGGTENTNPEASTHETALTFTVTYSGNGSESGTAPTDATAYGEGDSVTMLGNTGSLLKPGYDFDGWNTAADGSGTHYAEGSAFIVGNADITLYVQWKIDRLMIMADNTADNDLFGYRLTLSADGSRALISARNNTYNSISQSGSVYVFDFTVDHWSQTANFTADDADDEDHFGEDISLNSDGNIAVIGTNYDDDNGSNSGSAYVFVYSSDTAWTQKLKLTASDGVAGDSFGHRVAISSDGNTIISAAPNHTALSTNSGALYIYTTNDSWTTFSESKLAIDVEGLKLGSDVFLSADGSRAFAGAHLADSMRGRFYIFDTSDNWSSNSSTMIASPNTAVTSFFGSSISASLDGNTVLVGAYGDNHMASYAGAAYIYSYDDTDWEFDLKLTASDGTANDYFGRELGLSGDGTKAVISANKDDDYGILSGSAYYYKTEDGADWDEIEKLTNNNAQADDYFGISSAISSDGTTMLVGSYHDDDAANNGGTALFFVRED